MLTMKTAALLAGGALIMTSGVISPAGTASAEQTTATGVTVALPTRYKYSDDQVLTAVLFGAGPVASALGVHIGDETALPENSDELAAEVVREFRSDHAEVTDTALAAFRSGDPIRVHEAVRTLQRTFQETYFEGTPRVENGALCATVNLVLAGNLAVAINVGVAVTVAFVTWVVTRQVENDADAQLISARLADLGRE
jgi:SdpC family antimicrobial peptide